MEKTDPDEPGAAGTANRAGIDTPEQVRGHSMSKALAPSSLLYRWRIALAAVADARLSKADVAVLVVIADHLNAATGEAYPGAERLCRITGNSLRAIKYSRRKLVDLGYLIERRHPNDQRNHYRIGSPTGAMDCTGAENCTSAIASTDRCNALHPTGAMDCTGPVQPAAPEHAYRTSLKNIKKEPTKKLSSASRTGEQKGIDESFIRFWNAYPRKDAKADAAKAWGQVKGSQSIELILVDLSKRTADSQQWTERQFIPMPATYLRKQRWLDEWTAAPPAKTAGRVSVPSADKAAEINARADARLAKLGVVQ